MRALVKYRLQRAITTNWESTLSTVYDPLPTINRLEAFVTRLADAMGEFEERVDNHPQISLEDTLRGGLSHLNIQAKLQQYLDESDPSDPDFLDRIQKASNGIARIRELSPQWIKRKEDPRACATYPILQEILGKAIAVFSDTKDTSCRFFVAYYREFGMSEAAQLAMLRHADPSVAEQALRLMFGENEDAMESFKSINFQNIQDSRQLATSLYEAVLAAGGEAAEAARSALGKLDYTRMYLQFASAQMSANDLRGTVFGTAATLIEAAATLKRVFLAVMPYALIDVAHEPDQQLMQRIDQLESDLNGTLASYAAETSGESLDVREIVLIQEQQPEYSSGAVADLEHVRKLQFTHVAKPDRIVRDCEEVIIAAQHGAYKLATVGCGGLLEAVLREFVHRNNARVEDLRLSSDWKALFARKSVYINEANVLTWDLYTLINVSAFLFRKEDSELADHCHRLRTARNKIHGGGVGKEVCTFAISVIKAVVGYLN